MVRERRNVRRRAPKLPAPLGGDDFGASGRSIFGKETWSNLARSLQLSDREGQIVQAVFDDAKESAIARELGISRHTVHRHVERLYRKINVRSRAELIVRIFTEYLAIERPLKRSHSGYPRLKRAAFLSAQHASVHRRASR